MYQHGVHFGCRQRVLIYRHDERRIKTRDGLASVTFSNALLVTRCRIPRRCAYPRANAYYALSADICAINARLTGGILQSWLLCLRNTDSRPSAASTI
jgi:hypothetical protein